MNRDITGVKKVCTFCKQSAIKQQEITSRGCALTTEILGGVLNSKSNRFVPKSEEKVAHLKLRRTKCSRFTSFSDMKERRDCVPDREMTQEEQRGK